MHQMVVEKKLSSVIAISQLRVESVVLMSDASILQLKRNVSTAGQVKAIGDDGNFKFCFD